MFFVNILEQCAIFVQNQFQYLSSPIPNLMLTGTLNSITDMSFTRNNQILLI